MWSTIGHFLQELFCQCGFHFWVDSDCMHQVCSHCGEIREKPLG